VSPPDPARKFQTLLKRLRAEHPEIVQPPIAPPPAPLSPPPPPAAAPPAEVAADPALVAAAPSDPSPSAAPAPGASPDPETLVRELVHSFLVWEAGATRAATAMRRLEQAVVDFNELRVFLPGELVAVIGDRYPRASERAERLRSALNDLYRREHGVNLSCLLVLPKRDARAFLASLEGLPPFVAARVVLLILGAHAMPVDDRLCALLAAEDAIDPGATADEAAGWLERQLRAGEAVHVYTLLEAWAAGLPLPKTAKKPAKSTEAPAAPTSSAGPAAAEPERAKPSPGPEHAEARSGRRSTAKAPAKRKAASGEKDSKD
jgi:hypothetical protein